MEDVPFSNIQLRDDTRYFLYIGEFKACPLNEYLREALSRNSATPVDFVSIVPDVLKSYDGRNVMVINPVASGLARESGKPVTCRISPRRLASEVSRHPAVLQLVSRLLTRQPEVQIYQFESLPELTLDRLPGVRIIGPDKGLSHRWNNKIHQHQALENVVPMPEFRICKGLADTLHTVQRLASSWTDGIYISLESGGGGANSCIVFPTQDSTSHIREVFGTFDGPYLLSRFIPHRYDPTVLAVVGNDRDVYIAGIADQHIEKGNRFRGSIFPSVLPAELIHKLKQYTRRIGRRLGRSGYRGIFGCDYLVDAKDGILFLEINARKQGTTMEMSCTAEHALPPGSPSIPELEYWAVTQNRFPPNTAEMEGNPANIHWGTYNYKLDTDIQTDGFIPLSMDERTLFRNIADGRFAREAFCVVENIGENHLVKADSFLGRVIAVATNRPGVFRGLKTGKALIKDTIGEIIPNGQPESIERPLGPLHQRAVGHPVAPLRNGSA